VAEYRDGGRCYDDRGRGRKDDDRDARVSKGPQIETREQNQRAHGQRDGQGGEHHSAARGAH
jgi:hypothetical protein